MKILELGTRIAKRTYVSDLQDIHSSKPVCSKVGAHIRNRVGHNSSSVLYMILKKSLWRPQLSNSTGWRSKKWVINFVENTEILDREQPSTLISMTLPCHICNYIFNTKVSGNNVTMKTRPISYEPLTDWHSNKLEQHKQFISYCLI